MDLWYYPEDIRRFIWRDWTEIDASLGILLEDYSRLWIVYLKTFIHLKAVFHPENKPGHLGNDGLELVSTEPSLW